MKVITENLALASLIAISIGLVRINSYYGVFGVDIIPYLDIAEVFQIQFFYLLVIVGIIIYIAFFLFSIFYGGKYKLNENKTAFVTDNTKDNIHLYNIGSIIIALVGAVYFIGSITAINCARSIIKGESTNEVTMIGKNETLVTDRKLAYIGRTKNYIFFYDRNKHQSRVFKTEDIEEIRYMIGRNYAESNK